MNKFFFALFLSTTALASYSPSTVVTDPAGVNQATVSGAGALKVDPSAVTQPISAVGLPLPSGAATSSLQSTGNTTLASILSELESPAPVSGTVAVSNFPSTQAVSGTFWQSTQPVSAASWPLPTGAATSSLQSTGNTSLASILADLTNGTQVTTLTGTVPLPTGAATSALQTTGNTSLATLATNLPAQGQALAAASMPVVLTAAQLTTLTPPTLISAAQSGSWTTGRTWTLSSGTDSVNVGNFPTSYPVTGTFWQTTQPVSLSTVPLPTGAATSALQTTGNTSLATLATNLPAQGQALAAASMPVVLPAAQITTLTPPTSVTVTQATAANLNASVVGPSGVALAKDSSLTTINTTLGSPFQAGGSIGNTSFAATQGTAASLNATVVGPSGVALAKDSSLTTINTTLGTPLQAGGNIGNVTGTVSLPTGASTSALQTTGNTSLATLATNLPAQGQALAAASMPVVLPAAQITTLTPPTSVTVTQATAANLNTTVTGTVSTKAPVNANATLSARQSITGTETNLAAPSNAVAAIVECESGNSDNLRWGFSNSTTAILSTTLGMLCEPGRSENIPVGAGTYLHMIAVTTATSDYMDVQWVLSQ